MLMKITASKINENQWLIKVRKANILFQMSEQIAAWTLFLLWLDIQPVEVHNSTHVGRDGCQQMLFCHEGVQVF